MAIFEIRRNARVSIDTEAFRLCRRLDDGLWQLENETTGRLREHTELELLEMLRTERLTYAPEPSASDLQSRGASSATHPSTDGRAAWDGAAPSDREEAMRQLEYVKRTVDVYPRSAKGLAGPIATVALQRQEHAPSVSTVTRWIRRYIRGGRDGVALLSGVPRRGNRTDRIGSEMRALLDESLDARYLTKERPTLADTLDDAIVRVHKANQVREVSKPKLPQPRTRMLKSVLRCRDPFDVCALRYGREEAERRYRQSLLGRCISKGLARVELDHTPLNYMVIDTERFLPLGRPWLTMAIEIRHRAILGYALSFQPPSYASVMQCLRHAILPKTYLKQRYPALVHDWPFYGLMESLGLDNGKDLRSLGLDDFAARYGIELDFCAVGRPWGKGSIERALGTINRGVAHGIPGTTFADLFERGDYDSGKHACISLEQLHEIVHIWIVDYYHERVHRSLGMSPRASWDSEMRHRPIPLPASASELDQDLCVPDERTLTHKGIELDNLFYNSTECRPLLIRAGGSVRVKIRRNPEDLGYVYVLSAIDGKYLRVPVLERFADYATGLTQWQHTVCLRYVRTHFGGRNDALALATAKAHIQEVVAKALKDKRRSGLKSLARNLADQHPARADLAPALTSQLLDLSPADCKKVATLMLPTKPLSVSFVSRRRT